MIHISTGDTAFTIAAIVVVSVRALATLAAILLTTWHQRWIIRHTTSPGDAACLIKAACTAEPSLARFGSRRPAG